MYYELYVDVLFLVNFMMDYLLLLLVRKMLSCSATHGNICLGAVVGSFCTCIVVILPIPHAFIKFIMFHMFVNTFMIRVGLKIKCIKESIKALVMLYIGAFLLGGVLEYFYQYVKIGSLFFAIAIAGYYIVLGIWNFISHIQRTKQYKCQVDLYVAGREYHVQGMVDTGNGLRDPITNQPVSILDKKTLYNILKNEKIDKIRYIPYHSIGKQSGVLPVLRLDKMCIHREKEWWIEKPLIGISEEEISLGGEYQMILNPNLF